MQAYLSPKSQVAFADDFRGSDIINIELVKFYIAGKGKQTEKRTCRKGSATIGSDGTETDHPGGKSRRPLVHPVRHLVLQDGMSDCDGVLELC